MEIKELLAKQKNLIRMIDPYFERKYGPNASLYAKTEEMKTLVLALTDESHEALRELNWKPWKKTQKQEDLGKLAEEIADCWHFMLEITLLFNLEDTIEAFLNKTFKKNEDRANGGY